MFNGELLASSIAIDNLSTAVEITLLLPIIIKLIVPVMLVTLYLTYKVSHLTVQFPFIST